MRDPVPTITVAENEETPNYDHLELPSEDLIRSTIRTWKERLNIQSHERLPCAVCSRLNVRDAQKYIDANELDLTVLTNDLIPTELLPQDYNLLEYDKAILCARGLANTNKKGVIRTCQECLRDMKQGNLPKFALANFLYYARQRLPEDVRIAFEESTCFDRGLVSRARCNSITCRIPVPDEPIGDEVRTSSVFYRVQKAVRGNIIVAPLDTVMMHETLPPPVNSVMDTFCAVLVSKAMPTRSTIEKLHPILVRRTRVELMLEFLLKQNPQYKQVDGFRGFSADNLNALFANTRKDGTGPIQFGYLPDNPALDAANAGFTSCNIATKDGREIEGILMENVGYTMGDDTPLDYRQMKLQALHRCLSGKPFLLSASGSRMVPDFNNPYLLTWLFPHLDPWGIGGFYEPRRKRKLTLSEQLRYLLEIDDDTFQRDPEFAFVFYNIMRKMTVSSSLSFSVPVSAYDKVVKSIMALDKTEVVTLAQKFKEDPMYLPQSEKEREVARVLAAVGPVARKVPGSVGYKLCRRNEIRAMINFRGAPTLFVTINPDDIRHPLVSILARREIPHNSLLNNGDEGWQRALTAARNPAACAKFFDIMIRSFVAVVLRFGEKENGIYGKCNAYYGVVEAQGRGTLHCHMLVWLEGHPAPHVLKERLLSSAKYTTRLRKWVDRMLQSAHIEPTAAIAEAEAKLHKERREVGMTRPHPGMIPIPDIENLPSDEFSHRFSEFVNALLTEYNIHEHTGTCWKYLKRGEARTDKNCRLGMDGTHRPHTEIDAITAEVRPSQDNPWMASFTDVCTALLQCNFNIRYAGAGEAANAFLHYATDYTSKSQLKTHAGLAALSYAITQIRTKVDNEHTTENESLLKAITVAVNSMMAQQEISQQQVMSYLVGGGDYYTNESFQTMNWGEVVSHVKAGWNAIEGEEIEQEDGNSATVCLVPGGGNLSVSNRLLDYTLRSEEQPYDNMCLYHFLAAAKKETLTSHDGITNSRSHRGQFKEGHPHRHRQGLTIRTKYVVPVLLGPRMARRNGVKEEDERWARDMLTLFKPWRSPLDLKQRGNTWLDTFDTFMQQMEDRWKKTIENMEVLSASREAAKHSRNKDHYHTFLGEMAEDIFNNEEGRTYESNAFNDLEEYRDPTTVQEDVVSLEKIIGATCTRAFDLCYPQSGVGATHPGEVNIISPELRAKITDEAKFMASIRKIAEVRMESSNSNGDQNANQIDRRNTDIAPGVQISSLQDDHPFGFKGITHNDNGIPVIDSVINQYGLHNNPEQLRAFRIISDRLVGGGKQLLMYIGGAGGTGKSWVIRAIVDLLERLGRRKELLIGAPTGIAAVLIGGHTLHSLGFIGPNSKRNGPTHKLQELWRGVTTLIIDEVSMIGSQFFATFANRVTIAKGGDPGDNTSLFGGLNVIFTGDFCQLKPPKQQPLYSYQILDRPTAYQGTSEEGIQNFTGAYLWQRVDVVVNLTKSQRQIGDPVFAKALHHISRGSCKAAEAYGFRPEGLSIYEYFLSREISRRAHEDPEALGDFSDAPVVVGSKILRDRINAKLIIYHARRTNADVHLYHSVDTVKREVVDEHLREELWSLPSRRTNDMLGKLPLFIGMKVMLTENVALGGGVVNGSEGVVRGIVYKTDGPRRYAEVVYVEIEGCGVRVPGLEEAVVPIVPMATSIELPVAMGNAKSFRRKQIPMVPGYSYTDYKSQGRSLDRVIVDLVTARGQGAYVMLSRARSLNGLIILRWFDPTKIYQKMSPDLQRETSRLEKLDIETKGKLDDWDEHLRNLIDRQTHGTSTRTTTNEAV